MTDHTRLNVPALTVPALMLLMAALVAMPCVQAKDRVQAEDQVSPAIPSHPLTISQWVSPASSEALTGRVVVPSINGAAKAIADAKITLLSSDGTLWRATSDEVGRFTITDVPAGVYSVTAKTDEVFACSALHVVDAQGAAGADFPSEVEIAAASIDYTMIKNAVIRYLPAKTLGAEVALPTENLNDVAERVCGDQYLRVMQSDGGMSGSLRLAGGTLHAAGLTNVFVAKEGEVVARTVTDGEGNFQIDELPPGEYSLLAVGPAGVGFAGFELVGHEGGLEKQSTTDGDEKLIHRLGHRGSHCPSFKMQVAPMPQIIHCCDGGGIEEGPIVDGCGCGAPEPIVGDGEIVFDGLGTPLDGGYVPVGGYGGYGYGGYGGYGGGYGGGGGGFGGGGFGGIAALAGIGGLIAVAVDDDDNPVIIPPDPISPIK
ncbi:MAG: carboxypeptidase regulatory-like domain-containing protein [Novipirellula sp. JB048]